MEKQRELTDLGSIGDALRDAGERLAAAAGSLASASDADRDRLLSDIAVARDDIANFERALAEYLLHRVGGHYTQRTVAKLMNAGLSTVSRWSQQPIYFERIPTDD